MTTQILRIAHSTNPHHRSMQIKKKNLKQKRKEKGESESESETLYQFSLAHTIWASNLNSDAKSAISS